MTSFREAVRDSLREIGGAFVEGLLISLVFLSIGLLCFLPFVVTLFVNYAVGLDPVVIVVGLLSSFPWGIFWAKVIKKIGWLSDE